MNPLRRTLRRTLPLAAATLVTAGLSLAPVDGAGAMTSTTPDTAGTPTTATTDSRPAALDLSTLERGPRPRIPYAYDPHVPFGGGHFTVIRPDGSRLRLPEMPLGNFVVYRKRVVNAFGSEAGVQVYLVGPRGRFVGHYDQQGGLGFGLVVSPDHSVLAIQRPSGVVRTFSRQATRHVDLPKAPSGINAGAILGSRTCREQQPEGGGCTVFVSTDRPGRGRTYVTTSHGIVDRVPGIRAVADANQDGRVLGIVGRHDGRNCWGELDSDGTRRWSVCGTQLQDYSPNGRHVLGSRYAHQRTQVVVLDQQGRRTARWSWPSDAGHELGDVRWEDDGHLLAVVREHRRWAVVRLALDGSAELAVAPRRLERLDSAPFRLPER